MSGSEADGDIFVDSVGRLSIEGAGLPPFVTDRKTKSKPCVEMEEMKQQVAAMKKELDDLRRLSQSAGGQTNNANVVATERVPEFREIREYVTPFDPKVPSCPSADVWVKSIDDTGDLYHWSAALRLHCARLSLSGCAKLWFEGCHAAINSWADFKTEIVKGFPSAKTPSIIIICYLLKSGRAVKLLKSTYTRC